MGVGRIPGRDVKLGHYQTLPTGEVVWKTVLDETTAVELTVTLQPDTDIPPPLEP